jgi:hypothetical protein
MGLFGKKASAAAEGSSVALPPDLVSRLEPFGRFEFDPQGSGVDPIGLPSAEYPLMQMAKQDPDGFMDALAAATVPIGGWTVYGAMRLIWNFGLADPDVPQADSDAISMAALQFLHDCGYPQERLSPREMAFWRRIAGREWS